MKFIRSVLLADEKIVYFTKPHWIIFSAPVILFICTFLLLVLGPHIPSLQMRLLPWPIYQLCAAVVGLVGLWWAANALIVFYTSEFAVTNKRIIMKTGLIRRDTSELFLDKIEAVNVDQTILGRLLDYGTLILIGTGGSRDVYYTVPNPFQFRRMSQTQVDAERKTQHHL